MTPPNGRGDGAGDGRAHTASAVRALDLLVYGTAVVVIVTAASAAVSFGFGGDWAGVKNLLFLAGFLLFGAGSVGLFAFVVPKPRWPEEDVSTPGRRVDLGTARRALRSEETGEADRERGLAGTVWSLPPLSRYHLAPADRPSMSARLFVGGLLTLALSFTMEMGLGVGA